MGQTLLIEEIASHAVFSPDRSCRLMLFRVWAPSKGMLMFIGLNPSTADEEHDDPTIRRLVRFAKSWGLGGLMVCNLYTKVTPYPSELPETAPSQDDFVLLKQARHASMILAGWGAFTRAQGRAEHVKRLLASHKLHCLGTNKNGSPRHPLYIAANTKPQPFGMFDA